MPTYTLNPKYSPSVELLCAFAKSARDRGNKAMFVAAIALSALAATLIVTAALSYVVAKDSGPLTGYTASAREIYFDTGKLIGAGFVFATGLVAAGVEIVVAAVMLRRAHKLWDESATAYQLANLAEQEPDTGKKVYETYFAKITGVPVHA